MSTTTSTAPRIYPSVHYADTDAGIEFLKRAFGFAEKVIHRSADGATTHVELSYGPSIVFVGSTPDLVGAGHLYVAVDDADAHCAQARAAGATITREPFDTDYGSRDYRAQDPDGNSWLFGTYRPADGD